MSTLEHYRKSVPRLRKIIDGLLLLLAVGVGGNAVFRLVYPTESSIELLLLSIIGISWSLVFPIINLLRSKDRLQIQLNGEQKVDDKRKINDRDELIKDLHKQIAKWARKESELKIQIQEWARIESELKSKIREIKRDNKTLGKTAEFVSHDGYAMLQRNVVAIAELIKETKGNPKVTEKLGQLSESMKFLQAIVFSVPGNPHGPEQFKQFIRKTGSQFSISKLAQTQFEELIKNIGDKEPTCRRDGNPKLTWIESTKCKGCIAEKIETYGNEHFFAYCLTLLLQNAQRYADTDLGPIRLTVCRAVEQSHVIVANHGDDIPFDPFALGATSGKSGGYGLYIAKEIVTGLGGTLDYRFGEIGSIRFEIGGAHFYYDSEDNELPSTLEALEFDILSADKKRKKITLTVSTYLGTQGPASGADRGKPIHERDYEMPLDDEAEIENLDFATQSFVHWKARISLTDVPTLHISFPTKNMIFFHIELSSDL